MPRQPSIYKKLTARNRTFMGYTQLWLGPDHILVLSSNRISEEYKRFAFPDIQSIIVTRIPSPVVWQVIMAVAAVAWMSLWFTVDSRFAKWTFIVTGALGLLIPIVDILRGPRCRCYLHTRVTSERLAPVSRMRIARKFLSTLRPKIEAVQGALPADAATAVDTQVETPGAPPALVKDPGYLPEFLFATFLLDALLIWLSLVFPKAAEIPGVLSNTLFAEVLLIIISLIRRSGRDARVIAYVLIGLSIVGVGYDISTILREIFGWYVGIIEKAKNGDKSPFEMFSLFPTGSKKAVIAYSWRAAVGALGLAAAVIERRRLPKR